MNKKELLNHKFENLRYIIKSVLGRDPCEKTRKREVIDARKIFCLIAYDSRDSFDLSWVQILDNGKTIVEIPRSYITLESIGKFLNKDHSTMHFMLKAGRELLEVDDEFTISYNRVYSKFGLNFYKQLEYLNISIDQAEYNLEKLKQHRKKLIKSKKQNDDKSNLPKQGVLFEISEGF